MSPTTIAKDPWRIMPAVITDVHSEIPGVLSYCIELQEKFDAEQFVAQPGQFNMLYVPGVGEAAISISGNLANRSLLVHTIRAVGSVTNELARAQVGSTIGVRGPFGSHWPVDQCEGKDIVLVAGGIGMAPVRPVVHGLIADRQRFGTVTLLVGSRVPTDLLYANEYATWEQVGIDVETTVDRADQTWKGNIGVVTLLLQRLQLPRPADTVLMTCGPEIMMFYTIREAMQRGLSTESIWLSLERNMNCAIGHCGHCQLGPHFLCKDGPILRYDQVAQLLEVAAL